MHDPAKEIFSYMYVTYCEPVAILLDPQVTVTVTVSVSVLANCCELLP